MIRPFYKDHVRSSLIDMTVCMVLDQKVLDISNLYKNSYMCTYEKAYTSTILFGVRCLYMNSHCFVRPVSYIVSHVGWDRRGSPQAAVLWLPVLHGIDAGVPRSPDNHCYHQQQNQCSEERDHACQTQNLFRIRKWNLFRKSTSYFSIKIIINKLKLFLPAQKSDFGTYDQSPVRSHIAGI